jgi:hypothetical protein
MVSSFPFGMLQDLSPASSSGGYTGHKGKHGCRMCLIPTWDIEDLSWGVEAKGWFHHKCLAFWDRAAKMKVTQRKLVSTPPLDWNILTIK